ncbi:MAG: hypothetical protein AAF467_27340 [Actinomycetota bacterium]
MSIQPPAPPPYEWLGSKSYEGVAYLIHVDRPTDPPEVIANVGGVVIHEHQVMANGLDTNGPIGTDALGRAFLVAAERRFNETGGLVGHWNQLRGAGDE